MTFFFFALETVLVKGTGVGTTVDSVVEKPKEEDEDELVTGKTGSSRQCNTRSFSGFCTPFPITVLTFGPSFRIAQGDNPPFTRSDTEDVVVILCGRGAGPVRDSGEVLWTEVEEEELED